MMSTYGSRLAGPKLAIESAERGAYATLYQAISFLFVDQDRGIRPAVGLDHVLFPTADRQGSELAMHFLIDLGRRRNTDGRQRERLAHERAAHVRQASPDVSA